VGRKKFFGAVGPDVFAGAVVVGYSRHFVFRADGNDETDVGAEVRSSGGEEGETAGEAETDDADRTIVLMGGQPGGRIAYGGDAVGADVVVLDVRQLGSEDADAAGGHGGGEGNEAGLVNAEVVDAMKDHDGGRVGMAGWRIEAGSDGSTGEWEYEFGSRDGAGDEPAERCGDGLVRDEVEDGDGLEMSHGKGPRKSDEEGDGDEDDCSVEAGALSNGLTLAAKELASPVKADG
jgi:hypothetical protein